MNSKEVSKLAALKMNSKEVSKLATKGRLKKRLN